MTALLFQNARLIDPEKGTDEIGTLAVLFSDRHQPDPW